MGTLYVVGAPAGDPDDLTLRAVRCLEEAALIVADQAGVEDADWAGQLLARHGIGTPLVPLAVSREAADAAVILEELEEGDLALLVSGWSLGPSVPGCQFVHLALERGFPVVPIPGPALPITALILSGLPADSFIYLGELPHEPALRSKLLAVVASEQRTLVVLASHHQLVGNLADLYGALGDRPLVVVAASQNGTEILWRGTLGKACDLVPEQAVGIACVLVVGGTRERPPVWDEARLRSEIRARLSQGLGAKEISRELAAESGWPRRQVYRLVIEEGRSKSSPQSISK